MIDHIRFGQEPALFKPSMFDSKNKKIIKIIWGVLCILIILSMIILYTPLPGLQ